MNDQFLGWLVVPGIAVTAMGSVFSAVWTYVSTKDLARLASRLRREEEAFRIAHSPRVEAAIQLWCSFCDLERWLRRMLGRHRTQVGSAEDEERAAAEAGARLDRTVDQSVEAALASTEAARDRAEVLLDATTFARFDDAFRAYQACRASQCGAEIMEARGLDSGRFYDELIQRLERAEAKRGEALAALKALIGKEPSA